MNAALSTIKYDSKWVKPSGALVPILSRILQPQASAFSYILAYIAAPSQIADARLANSADGFRKSTVAPGVFPPHVGKPQERPDGSQENLKLFRGVGDEC